MLEQIINLIRLFFRKKIQMYSSIKLLQIDKPSLLRQQNIKDAHGTHAPPIERLKSKKRHEALHP
jgi:hypothetical protein